MKTEKDFLSIETAKTIAVGDLVRIKDGYLAGNTAIVTSVGEASNCTAAPCYGWWFGPAITFQTDLGPVFHFALDKDQPIEVKHWVTKEQLAS